LKLVPVPRPTLFGEHEGSPTKVGADHQYNHTTSITTFQDHLLNQPPFQPPYHFFTPNIMESRIQEAIRFIDRFPEALVAKVAEQFEVLRGRL
jgi:hypothetical protein